MATPFADVYERFLQKISDYSFLNLQAEQIEERLKGYLFSSIPKFKQCKKYIRDIDDVMETFNSDLDSEEKEILSHLMVVEYMMPQILTSQLMKQSLSDRDFKTYSQANQIRELINVKNEMQSEVERMIMSYTYNQGFDFLHEN